jgi:hypothetical protein
MASLPGYFWGVISNICAGCKGKWFMAVPDDAKKSDASVKLSIKSDNLVENLKSREKWDGFVKSPQARRANHEE